MPRVCGGDAISYIRLVVYPSPNAGRAGTTQDAEEGVTANDEKWGASGSQSSPRGVTRGKRLFIIITTTSRSRRK